MLTRGLDPGLQHAKRVTVQCAEVAVPRQLFASILEPRSDDTHRLAAIL
jgi:hypothetical protein